MAEMRAYHPSLRERLAWALAGGAEMLGAGRYAQQDIAKRASGLMDFIPGVGEAVGLDDAMNDFRAGNYGAAALGLGSTALGAVPGVGDAAASVGRRATNYLRNLGHETPSLYREMNAERALDFFNAGGLQNGPAGQRSLYWSNVPELARGQNGNTGIRFKMDADGVMGVDDVKSKPGLQFVADNSGGREFISRDGVDFAKVKEITVDPSVMFGGTPDDRLFLRHMKQRVDSGEFATETPDGFVTVYRRAEK